MSRDGGRSVWQRARGLICPTACEPPYLHTEDSVLLPHLLGVDLGPLIFQGYKLACGQEGQRWRKKQVRHR